MIVLEYFVYHGIKITLNQVYLSRLKQNQEIKIRSNQVYLFLLDFLLFLLKL